MKLPIKSATAVVNAVEIEPDPEPDGFVCAKCGRTCFAPTLAPHCSRCRQEARNRGGQDG
jgi:hypothetical protein